MQKTINRVLLAATLLFGTVTVATAQEACCPKDKCAACCKTAEACKKCCEGKTACCTEKKACCVKK